MTSFLLQWLGSTYGPEPPGLQEVTRFPSVTFSTSKSRCPFVPRAPFVPYRTSLFALILCLLINFDNVMLEFPILVTGVTW